VCIWERGSGDQGTCRRWVDGWGVVVNDGKDGILGDREVCAVNFVVW
jgi:hypothetical protein